MLLQSGVSIGGGRIDGWTKIEDVLTGGLGGVAGNPGIIFVFLAIGIISIAGLGWFFFSSWLPTLSTLGEVLFQKNDLMALAWHCFISGS